MALTSIGCVLETTDLMPIEDVLGSNLCTPWGITLGSWGALGIDPIGPWEALGIDPIGPWGALGMDPIGPWGALGIDPIGPWEALGIDPIGPTPFRDALRLDASKPLIYI
jgi:hypothetical protein